MNSKDIEKIIEEAWSKKEQINKDSDQKIIDVINQSITVSYTHLTLPTKRIV